MGNIVIDLFNIYYAGKNNPENASTSSESNFLSRLYGALGNGILSGTIRINHPQDLSEIIALDDLAENYPGFPLEEYAECQIWANSIDGDHIVHSLKSNSLYLLGTGRETKRVHSNPKSFFEMAKKYARLSDDENFFFYQTDFTMVGDLTKHSKIIGKMNAPEINKEICALLKPTNNVVSNDKFIMTYDELEIMLVLIPQSYSSTVDIHSKWWLSCTSCSSLHADPDRRSDLTSFFKGIEKIGFQL